MAKCALIFVALATLTAAASGRALTQTMTSVSPMMNGMGSSNMQMSPGMNMGMAKSPMAMSGSDMAMPPMMMGSGMAMAPSMGMMTVTQTAMANPMLSTLVMALNKTGLAAMLNDPNLMATVFAPTNDAFMAFMKMNNMTQDQLLNAPTLKPILQYHVVPNMAAMAANLTNMEMLPTMLSGNDLMVHTTMMNGMMGVMIDGAASNATVTSANMMADKSIIHVVNTVLVPSTKTLNYYKPTAAST